VNTKFEFKRTASHVADVAIFVQ